MGLFRTEMQTLALLADVAATRGHRIVESADGTAGHTGNVGYTIDAMGVPRITLLRQLSPMEVKDAKTLIADLLSAMERLSYMEFSQKLKEELSPKAAIVTNDGAKDSESSVSPVFEGENHD